MTRLVQLALVSGATVVLTSPVAVDRESQTAHARSCQARAAGAYGFQCHGSAFTGTVFEPVTFVGTAEGNEDGFYEGFGTFNSSGGSVSTHVAGQATIGQNCFGHVDYTTNEILLPGGGTVPLPPISFDFAVVDNGKEILGSGVAPAGVTGDLVPRLTCRLVRIRP